MTAVKSCDIFIVNVTRPQRKNKHINHTIFKTFTFRREFGSTLTCCFFFMNIQSKRFSFFLKKDFPDFSIRLLTF